MREPDETHRVEGNNNNTQYEAIKHVVHCVKASLQKRVGPPDSKVHASHDADAGKNNLK